MSARRLNRKMTRRLPARAEKAAALAVTEGAEEIVQMQKRLVPVDKGALQKSITFTPPGGLTPAYSQPGGQQRARKGQAIITAGNSEVRYPHLVEYGAAPHFIKARSGSVLSDGQSVFGGAVMHPGAPAQPFFWPAYRALRGRVKSRITRAINKAVKDGASESGS